MLSGHSRLLGVAMTAFHPWRPLESSFFTIGRRPNAAARSCTAFGIKRLDFE